MPQSRRFEKVRRPRIQKVVLFTLLGAFNLVTSASEQALPKQGSADEIIQEKTVTEPPSNGIETSETPRRKAEKDCDEASTECYSNLEVQIATEDSSQEETLPQKEVQERRYELSVTKPNIQLFEGEGLGRTKRMKTVLDEMMKMQPELWHQSFQENLEVLFNQTPFYDSQEGFLVQEFRGEWSASSVSINLDSVLAEQQDVDQGEGKDLSWSEKFFTGVTTEAKEIYEGAKNFAKNAVMQDINGSKKEVDPKSIHEGFDEIYGWSYLSYEVQFYDVDLELLEAIYRNEDEETLQALAQEDLEIQKAAGQDKKTLIYIQDLIRKTETKNKNTLLAELNVSIKLYESDYVDQSVSFKFDRIFGGTPSKESSIAEKSTKLILRQDLEVMARKNIEVLATRECTLQTSLNFHAIDAIESNEAASTNKFNLPEVMSDWAKQLNDDYSSENSYFLEGTGVDQEILNNQRLYFVDLAVDNVGDSECFPKQVKGLFLNKRKNEWMSRFMGYGIMYLLLSGLSIVMSAFQYREVKINQLQGRAAAKAITPVPLVLLTSWTFGSLFFHLVISLTMLFVDIAGQICPILALLGVSIAFYTLSYQAAATQQVKLRQSDMIATIFFVSFTLIIFSPRIMTENVDTIVIFGFLWLPQIVSNLFSHPSWMFHYRLDFILIQSCYFIFPPLYARGFHNNFYFLKPDPLPVQALLLSYSFQIVILYLQKHCCDWAVWLKCVHRSKSCRLCLTQRCRRGLRKCLLRKVKAQHEWGWCIALKKIAEEKASRASHVKKTEQRNSNVASNNSGPFSQSQDTAVAAIGASANIDVDRLSQQAQLSSRATNSRSSQLVAPNDHPLHIDLFFDSVNDEIEYPESITHLKFKFYLYFRSFRTKQQSAERQQAEDAVGTGDRRHNQRRSVNSFKDGVQNIDESCGTVDSPHAEEVDCAICTGCLKYRPYQTNEDGSPIEDKTKLARCSGYYETPCLHVYHKQCILAWFNEKLECPQCRSPVPKPYDYDGAATSLYSDEEEDPAPLIAVLNSSNAQSNSMQQEVVVRPENPDRRQPGESRNNIVMADAHGNLTTNRQAAYRLSSHDFSDTQQQRSIANEPIPFFDGLNDFASPVVITTEAPQVINSPRGNNNNNPWKCLTERVMGGQNDSATLPSFVELVRKDSCTLSESNQVRSHSLPGGQTPLNRSTTSGEERCATE